MSGKSRRQGDAFEEAVLAALGAGEARASLGLTSEARKRADEAAAAIIDRLGAAPTRTVRGIGGQWEVVAGTTTLRVSLAWNSPDLRHPRPQGLPRHFGHTTRSAPARELRGAFEGIGGRFREAAGFEGLFQDASPALRRRLYRDTNHAVREWLLRHVATDAVATTKLWIHLTGGAYLQVIGRRRGVEVIDRSGLPNPDAVSLLPVDDAYLLCTFSNGDRALLRLHTASKAYKPTGQLSLKYAVTAGTPAQLEAVLDENEPADPADYDLPDAEPTDNRTDAPDDAPKDQGAAASPAGASNRHAGDCFEYLFCEQLQRHYRIGSDDFTAKVQMRDRARLGTLPAETLVRLESASALLCRWFAARWAARFPSQPLQVHRLPDTAGEAGDNADVRAVGSEPTETIGVSLKHNNDVLKNHRPWSFPTQCGIPREQPPHREWPDRLREVCTPTMRMLVDGRIGDLPKADRESLYRAVASLSADALRSWSSGSPEVPPSLHRFLFGRGDAVVAIAWPQHLEIREYSAEPPMRIEASDAVGKRLFVAFSNGAATQWRIHTASSTYRGGQFPLKWDARATSAPAWSEVMALGGDPP